MGDKVLSILDSMDRLDSRDKLLAGALRALSTIAREVDTEILAPCGESPNSPPLDRQVRDLATAPQLPAIAQLGHDMTSRLRSCGRQLNGLMSSAKSLPEILTALINATAALRDGGSRQEVRFREIAVEFDAAAALPDVESMRRKIQAQTVELVAYVDKTSAENRATVAGLEAEMATCRRRLAEAETLALSDSLTGLGNRRAVESRIEALVAGGRTFCLIMIDLNRFKLINDNYGHAAGDEVLAGFAARLRNHLRAADFAARWGGDEFLVVMECALNDAIRRSHQIQSVVCGRYSLSRVNGSPRVEVSATIGVGERKEGETAQQLFARTDSMLYATKQGE